MNKLHCVMVTKMGEGFDFYAVRKDKIGEAPKGVKKFIDDFFEEKTIFGIECFVAIGSDYKAPWIAAEDKNYHKGLTQAEINDCGVYSWFRNHPEYVYIHHWQ